MQKSIIYFRFSIITLAILVVLLAGCSRSDGLTIDCDVFEDNNNQMAEITVTAGEEFTVSLCKLSNYGYRWSEDAVIDNPAAVQQLSYEYDPGRSPMGGIPGKDIWVFRALEPGNAVISLEHTQPSGMNTRGIWAYKLAVVVRPD
ncbi:MAG: protease inhibitor I42 family protein [Candidatus Promineifilaceae bacterium]|jgi:predicted secreted protein